MIKTTQKQKITTRFRQQLVIEEVRPTFAPL